MTSYIVYDGLDYCWVNVYSPLCFHRNYILCLLWFWDWTCDILCPGDWREKWMCEFWMKAPRGCMILLIPTGASRLYHEKSILQMNAAPNQPGLLNRSMELSHSQKYAVDPKAEVVLASLQPCKQNNNNNSNNIIIVTKAYYWMPVRYC